MVRGDKLVDYAFAVGAVIITVGLAVGFWCSLRSLRDTATALGNTKRLTIGELKHLRAQDGEARVAKVVGTLSCSEPWRSTLASVPCCWSKVTVDGRHNSGGHMITWLPYYGQDIIRQVPMEIHDDTGTASVDATGASVQYADLVYEQVTSVRPKLFPGIPASETGLYRIREYVIRPGAHAVVVGPVAQTVSSSSDPIIGVNRRSQASSEHMPYIIALGDEAKVVRRANGAQGMQLRMILVILIGGPACSGLIKHMWRRRRNP